MMPVPVPAAWLQTIPQAIPQGTDYIRILPELILSAFGIVVMVLDPLVDEEKSQKTLGLIAIGRRTRGPGFDLVYGAVSRPGFFEHGAGRQLQRVLPFSGHRHRRGGHPEFV